MTSNFNVVLLSNPTLDEDTKSEAVPPPEPPAAAPAPVPAEMPAESTPFPPPAYTSTDAGHWTEINEDAIDYWIRNGPIQCQNRDADFSSSEQQYKHQKRSFSKGLLNRMLVNGEIVPRDWLLYSLSTGCAFCFVCCLFGKRDNASKFASCGFNDWKHPRERVHEHEGSEAHRKNMIVWVNRITEKGQIDFGLRQQFETECQYWTDVLKRVVATVKFLSELGLAFRGDTHTFGSPNNGNYMGCLELISQFDPFLREHIARFGNAGRGTPSYLSTTICDEFVHLMWEKVLSEIINDIQIAKYFSISVYSTPDVSHTDQLTFIMRCVSRGIYTGTLREILGDKQSHR